MSQKSSVPQAVSFVSQVLKRDNSEPRGSISGLGFAYCDFYQHNPRAEMMSRLPGRTAHRAAGARR